ncbi:hypothetical protein CB1_001113017 [Camelus ferus]|nr:hypothetical protein CB1_001113017 [Camelus ferus]
MYGHAHSPEPEKRLPSSAYCAVAPAGSPAMPKNALVIIRYGPYSSVGLSVEHRTYRLEGLLAVLAKDGHSVILEKIEDWNVVELMVNGEVVFHCNIKDLEFEQQLPLAVSGVQTKAAILDHHHWTHQSDKATPTCPSACIA